MNYNGDPEDKSPLWFDVVEKSHNAQVKDNLFLDRRKKMLKIQEFSGKGRGVVTITPFRKGQLVEKCPVIVIPKGEVGFIEKTRISDYCFCWGENSCELALATGCGSFYNHSNNANTRFERDYESISLLFYAVSDIESGQEITIDYCQGCDDRSSLWFQVREDD